MYIKTLANPIEAARILTCELYQKDAENSVKGTLLLKSVVPALLRSESQKVLVFVVYNDFHPFSEHLTFVVCDYEKNAEYSVAVSKQLTECILPAFSEGSDWDIESLDRMLSKNGKEELDKMSAGDFHGCTKDEQLLILVHYLDNNSTPFNL